MAKGQTATEYLIILAVVIIIALIVIGVMGGLPGTVSQEDRGCEVDSDCMIFGEDGDCNCGCFNKDYDWSSTGECFCKAPLLCRCVDGVCKNGFEATTFEECVRLGNPVMESYPRRCKSNGDSFVEDSCSAPSGEVLTIADAKEIASNDCEGGLDGTWVCNENTGTIWFDSTLSKELCTNPACVVDIVERTAEINWRCTGAVE